jgi:hypothetical protein
MQQVPQALHDLEQSLKVGNDGVLLDPSCCDALRSLAGLDMQINEMLLEYAGRFSL